MKSIEQAVQENPTLSKYKIMTWTEKSIKDFWDFESLFPENYFTYQHGQNLADFIYPYIKNSSQALDYGAGNGFFTNQLLNKRVHTATFDLSQESSESSNNKFCNHPDYLGAFNNNTITQQDGCFDVVFLLEVIEHLDTTTRSLVLGQIHKILKKNGTVVISTPNQENLANNLIINPLTMEIFHRWQHCYSWSADSLKKEIEHNNFTVQHTHEIDLKYVGTSPIKIVKRHLKRHKRQPHLIVIAKKS